MSKFIKLLVSAALTFTVLLSYFHSQAQSKDSLSFHELNLEKIDRDSTHQSLSFLSPLIKNKSIIALGEASHGTEEFYKIKSAITKYLITQENYKILLIEMDEYIARRINGYVRFHDTSLEDVKKILKNYGLYNSSTFSDLLTWIKAFNNQQSRENLKVSFSGIDNSEYWADPFTRDKMMAQNVLDITSGASNKFILWSHNSHIVKSNTWDVTNSGVKSMGNYIFESRNDQFFVLAIDTYHGKLNTIEEGKIKAYDFAMEKQLLNAPYDNFFTAFNQFNVNKEHKAVAYDLTHLSSNLHGNPQKFPVILGKDIDALIFIKKTTESKELE